MDGDAKILQQIIQLVVLTIGLLAVIKVIQERNNLMRTVTGYADKLQKTIKLDQGLNKVRAGTGKRAVAYGKFGATTGARWARNSKGGQLALGDPNDPSAIARGARSVRDRVRRARSFDQAILEANEGRKNQKQIERQALSHEIADQSSALKSFGGTNYENYVAGQRQKALNERVSEITAKWELGNTDAKEIGRAFAAAVNGDKNPENNAIITAAIGRLSQMGAYGANALGEQLGGLSGVDKDRKDVIQAALNTGPTYGSLISKAGDIAKGEIDESTGTFRFGGGSGDEMSGLSAEQVAGQSEQALMRNGAINSITKETAEAIVSNPTLLSKITSDEARKMILHRSQDRQVNTSRQDPANPTESKWKIDSYA